MSQLVSFVIPCYRSSQTIGRVVEEIDMTMKGLTAYRYEIVLVNDASPDDTFETIRHARGDVVVCLDDDGQTPADEAGKLLAGLEEGYDVVYAKYTHKQHSLFRNFGSRVNERMTRMMLGKPKELYISSYFAMKKFVAEELVRYENPFPYVIGLVLRTTKKIANVEVTHREREIRQFRWGSAP